ncbi:MAG: prephenate dehydrogenase/arogenate dehydrogenase family protein [Acidimicrobiales bacterium]
MTETKRRANVIGSGLIGGSVAMGLRANDWHVSVSDVDESVEAMAMEVGAADAIGLDPDAEITIVAVPVSLIADEVERALAVTTGYVTDVGSTKLDICLAIDTPRFIGGHPMAGSEQDGLVGARPQLFQGAMWILTPLETTDEDAFAAVRRVIKLLGAESITLHPRAHDQMVAQVSHIPT